MSYIEYERLVSYFKCYQNGWDNAEAKLRPEIERLRAENDRLKDRIDEHHRTFEPMRAAIRTAERERCEQELYKCVDRGLISWASGQELVAAIRRGESRKGEP